MNPKKESLQKKVKELDSLVQYFENSGEDFDLEAGLAKYEQAMKMVQEVKKELESYELKIKEIEAKYADEPEPDVNSLLD